jgi:hypothetical protein
MSAWGTGAEEPHLRPWPDRQTGAPRSRGPDRHAQDHSPPDDNATVSQWGSGCWSGSLPWQSEAHVEVELLVAYLSDLKRAYDFVFLFESAVNRLTSPSGLQIGLPFRWRLRGFDVEWPPTAEQAASIVPQSQQLVLANVTIHSLGFWDFLGALNPLEVLQQYG